LSQGQFEPVPVVGKVTANLPPFNQEQSLDGVFGVEITTPFIENNFLDCQSLKGYSGVDLYGI